MIEQRIRELVERAIDAARRSGQLAVDQTPAFEVTVPARREHGDWSTNAALALQRQAGRPPREVAQLLVDHLPAADWVLKTDIAGPGFINFTLSPVWLHDVVRRILESGERFGSNVMGAGQRVQVEFVSANPTGPLHVAHGRNAVVGDAIARLLEFTGHDVAREYYFNDAGAQMAHFGDSVAARYLELLGREVTFPEEGYQGEYVYDLARQVLDEDGDRWAGLEFETLAAAMRERAYPIVFGWIQATLERMRVRFDVWFKERDLYESGAVKEVVEELRAKGLVYERDDATWLASERFGDVRDRVLVKSSGEMTYLAGDIAYHRDKARRGFQRVINLWGADHHGQVPSLRAGVAALGLDPDWLQIVLMQLVHVFRAGTPVRMSKRMGTQVALDDLVDEVGVDAARYNLLQTSSDHDLRFDIEEVKRQTLENPVYYVQYAHARIASILRKAAERGAPDDSAERLDLVAEEAETELMRMLAGFEEVVEAAARRREPYRVTKYAEELAKAFHRFYTECRVVTDDGALTSARLALCLAGKRVLANALALLGVEAPERMEREETS